MIKSVGHHVRWLLMLCLLGNEFALAQSEQDAPLELLAALDSSSRTEQLEFFAEQLVDHEIGLGAMQKIGGSWRFKDSERRSGLLTSYIWQVTDGFSAAEVLAALETKMNTREHTGLLFHCNGRSCGHPNQWANRVFGQRLLYGAADKQQYRVYAVSGDKPGRMVLYSASRSADRQYLQAQWLQMAPEIGAGKSSEEVGQP